MMLVLCQYTLKSYNFNKLKFNAVFIRNAFVLRDFKGVQHNKKHWLDIFVPHSRLSIRTYHEKKNIALGQRDPHSVFVNKDVPLYSYGNVKFFRRLTLFSYSQLIFWSYLSHVAITTMKDVPVSQEEIVKARESLLTDKPTFVSIWRRINLGKFKDTIGVICGTIGLMSVIIASLYTKNSARTIILMKGGENILIEFFAVFGASKRHTFPLINISAKNSRQNAKGYVILKVKERPLHVILDMSGNFPNKELFDKTAGLRRLL